MELQEGEAGPKEVWFQLESGYGGVEVVAVEEGVPLEWWEGLQGWG